jgi:guanylate kinase
MLLVLIGKSGSGKSSIAKELQKQRDIPELLTYTTRKSRGDNDNHIFATDKDYYNCKDILAETEYGGYRYWTAHHQLIVGTQTLIVDNNGLKSLYNTDYAMTVIYVECDEHIREQRVGRERMDRDKGFEFIKVDYVVDNSGSIEDTVRRISEII